MLSVVLKVALFLGVYGSNQFHIPYWFRDFVETVFAGFYFCDLNKQIIMKKGHLISAIQASSSILNRILVFKKSDLFTFT